MLKSGHTTPRLKLFSILSLILEKSRNSVSQITKFFKAWYLLISLVSSLPTFPRLFTIYLYGHILSCLWSLACGCSLSKIPPPPQLSLIWLLLHALPYKPALTPQVPPLCLYSTLCISC